MSGLLLSLVVLLLLVGFAVAHTVTWTTPDTNDAETHPRWVDQHDYG